ncbi:MAG: MmgE/PrpD family protein [Candidatus Acidiferrum sp.]
MTYAERLAEYVCRVSYDDISQDAREQLKIHILDSLGCAVGAIGSEPVQLVRNQVEEFDGEGNCTLIGGGRAAPDRASFYNGALVRYLDFNDSYLSKGETCHPSDNLAPVLAATEYANGTGRELMTALAVAYQVQCRLSDVAPVRAAGFDHTTQGAYAVAAGVSKALELNAAQTANAIGICGTAFNALRVTRTGRLSHWKGLAYPNTSAACTFATFLARKGVTGPVEVFEGEKGFMDAIVGCFYIDWTREALERVNATILKTYNAEVHAQTAIECALQLSKEEKFNPADIQHIDVETFDVAYRIIGGGEEGDKTMVGTKEEADHSLPYLISVALLDGQVMPEQYSLDRISRSDVQELLNKVSIYPREEFSSRFPNEMPCRLAIALGDGRVLTKEISDYPGFITQPMTWEMAFEKLERVASPSTTSSARRSIADAVKNLETINVRDLTRLLHDLGAPKKNVQKASSVRKES